MKKQTLKYLVEPEPTKDYHFFLSSVGEWRTGRNLEELINKMKRDNLPFNVFYVPLPDDAEYKIDFYAPQVKGAVFLGHYGFEEN
jgi:hypothetical protein